MELTDLRKERSELPAISSKYAGLGAAIAAELMILHWNHQGVWVVDSLNHCVGAALMSSK